jgi:AcrR family transcriptional regulator
MANRGRPRTFDREQALARAMNVFWAKGFEGASMADLTAAMGIGSPSLYAAFGSKEALFREAVAFYSSTDGADIWAVITNAATAYRAVEGFLMETARLFSRGDKPSGCLVVLSALHSTDGNETVRAELIAKREQNIVNLARRLSQGVASGEISPGTDTRALAQFYVTVQQGMSIQARDGADRATLEGIARSALAAWGPLTANTPIRNAIEMAG